MENNNIEQKSNKKIENDKKRIDIIKILSLIAIATIPFCVIFLKFAILLALSSLLSILGYFVFLILSFCSFACVLASSILILATDFSSEELQKSKVLWGLLTLLLLGPIASLIFCSKAKTELKD